MECAFVREAFGIPERPENRKARSLKRQGLYRVLALKCFSITPKLGIMARCLDNAKEFMRMGRSRHGRA